MCPRTHPRAVPQPPPKARTARRARGVTRAPLVNATTEALLRIFWLEFIWHSFWALVETAARVLSPLALREFLRWLQRDAADGAAEADWRGWLLALAVLAGGGSLTLIHHVFFWWAGLTAEVWFGTIWTPNAGTVGREGWGGVCAHGRE
jgi:hypothetical protein